jgi:hypothetical protein
MKRIFFLWILVPFCLCSNDADRAEQLLKSIAARRDSGQKDLEVRPVVDPLADSSIGDGEDDEIDDEEEYGSEEAGQQEAFSDDHEHEPELSGEEMSEYFSEVGTETIEATQ